MFQIKVLQGGAKMEGLLLLPFLIANIIMLHSALQNKIKHQLISYNPDLMDQHIFNQLFNNKIHTIVVSYYYLPEASAIVDYLDKVYKLSPSTYNNLLNLTYKDLLQIYATQLVIEDLQIKGVSIKALTTDMLSIKCSGNRFHDNVGETVDPSLWFKFILPHFIKKYKSIESTTDPSINANFV